MVVPYGLELAAFAVLHDIRTWGGDVHCIVNDWQNERIAALAEAVGATWSAGPATYGFTKQLFNPRTLVSTIRAILAASADLLRVAAAKHATHVFVPDFGIVIRTWPALALLRWRGVTVVFSVASPPARERFYPRLWRRVIAPFVDVFVPNSAFTRDELLAVGIPKQKVHAPIYPQALGRDAATVAQGPGDLRRVVFVGQTIPEKGAHVLLDAAGILAREGLDLSLDIIGPIDGWEAPEHQGYRGRLRDRAAQPDLAGRVRFHGYIPDVGRVLAAAGVHCCPSLPQQREAFGLVNVEAKQTGIPSVVFPTGALPELVTHQVDGWVCRDVSAESLAEGLRYFLTDGETLREAGRAARASADRFSAARSTEQWKTLFQAR